MVRLKSSNNLKYRLIISSFLFGNWIYLPLLNTLNFKFNLFLSLFFLSGNYPSKYRPMIWRFLLKLPENTFEFSKLGENRKNIMQCNFE